VLAKARCGANWNLFPRISRVASRKSTAPGRSTDLSQRAREAWEPEKPLTCPGIAVGHFESAKSLSYAVLLVPTGHPDEGYRFLVFSQKLGQPGYEVRVLDKLDEKGPCWHRRTRSFRNDSEQDYCWVGLEIPFYCGGWPTR
jgi:hypothetical protein